MAYDKSAWTRHHSPIVSPPHPAASPLDAATVGFVSSPWIWLHRRDTISTFSDCILCSKNPIEDCILCSKNSIEGDIVLCCILQKSQIAGCELLSQKDCQVARFGLQHLNN
ncbi:hypothetical protein DAI22_07g257950 [Oryza sativa Japonica Group]|nr:hypothetical protein DAI22_07g257950 [Oryza sativa Japonica Group]